MNYDLQLTIWLQRAVLALILSTLNALLANAFAQGSLTPPGAPAPTMKTLLQIEPRTPISTVPFTINQPGSYYLTTNVTTTVSNAITITASSVTLDLNGFTIRSSVASAANGGTAILLGSGSSDITIANGHIRGGVTNNAGVYNGSGFGSGIDYSGNEPVNVLVSGISVFGCLYTGIYLNQNSTVVQNCTVRTAGSYGIAASTIKSSTARDCGSIALYGDQVSDCRGAGIDNGYGIYAFTALNCVGTSTVGVGVYAANAQNCYGDSASGDGLRGFTVTNCRGNSVSGAGIRSYGTAIGCYGLSTIGTGLVAVIANSCAASSTSVDFKYNMP